MNWFRSQIKHKPKMRDNTGSHETSVLVEDRLNPSIGSVYTRVENPVQDAATLKDFLDQENESYSGFSRENPHVLQAANNTIVVIPSPNKWNCFNIRGRTKLTKVCTNIKEVISSSELDKLGGIMNTTTSLRPTALEINSLQFTIDHNSKVTRTGAAPDYKSQLGSSSRDEVTRSTGGHKRLTLREKIAIQRAGRAAGSKPGTANDDVTRHGGVTRRDGVTRHDDVTPDDNVTRNDDVTPRDGVTPHDDVTSVESQTGSRLTKATSFDVGSGRSIGQHQSAGRSHSVNAITEEKKIFGFKVMKGALPSSSTSVGKKKEQKSNSYIRSGSLRQPRQGANSTRCNDKAEKESSVSTSKDLAAGTICAAKESGVSTSKELAPKTPPVAKESSQRHERTVDSPDGSNMDDKADKVVETKKEKGRINRVVIRTESLQEGKTRLHELREKQRRGQLTRSLTNPDNGEGSESSSEKNKNISDSLAEIRGRIRERRRKKEQFKRSKSLPETELNEQYEREEEREKEEEKRKEKEREEKREKEREEEREKEKEKEREKEEEKTKEKEREEKREKEREEEREKEKQKEREKKNEKEKENNLDTCDATHSELVSKEQTKKQEDKVLHEERKGRDEEVKLNEREETKTEEVAMSSEEQEDTNINKVVSSVKTESNPEPTILTGEKDKETSRTEISKVDPKKPTKRERRRLERYQRSKTMTDIMYNDIFSAAKREMKHKDDAGNSDRNGEPLPILSVSEIKKRFLESEGANGNSKMSEPGLFYSAKPSSGVSSKKENSKDVDKVTKKKEERLAENKPKLTKSCFQNKTNLSRRHTLDMGADFTNHAAVQNEKSGMDEQCHVGRSRISSVKEEPLSLSGGHLPKRRHTISEVSSVSTSKHSPLKSSESVEKLRERFSRGEAIFPNRWVSSQSKDTSKKTCPNEDKKTNDKVTLNVEGRRRVKSDEGGAKMATEIYVKKSPLIRRHTIGNQPTSDQPVKTDTEKDTKNDKLERRKFYEKFLLKDNEVGKKEPAIVEMKKEEERTIAAASATEKLGKTRGLKIDERKKKKDGKTSVSKLRKLFLGKPASAEKKMKLKEKRARTIAGGITPELVKELEMKTTDSNEDLPNRSTVEPHLYVAEITSEVPTTERNSGNSSLSNQDTKTKASKEFRSRRGSDLNPHSYLSSDYEASPRDYTALSRDDTEVDSVFHDEHKPEDGQHSSINADDSSAFVKSNPSQDMSTVEQNTKYNENNSEPEISKDSGTSIKDQCLDDYLTTIKTLASSPKTQRRSPRGSPQRVKFRKQLVHGDTNASEGDNLASVDQNTHPSVAKTKLSMHSFSTSDLDKVFYGGDSKIHHVASEMEVSAMDFDEISDSTTRLQSLTEGRTKVRPKRSSSKSLNPLKSLLERSDVRTSTEEPEDEEKQASGFENPKKRSTPRKKRSQLEPWRRHTLDPVALAALASREDFSRVSLRKTKGPGKDKDEFGGSLPVMLIQIKGRRQVQTRLVEPKQSSLNSGDCFLLVTPKELFCWIGNKANTIEKAKAVEISSKIQKRRDLNCKTGDVLYIDEAKQGNSLAYKKFCKILEGDPATPIEDSKLCPDDEFYEREMISTNKVYKLQESDPPHLIPVTELCGHIPRIALLNTKEVFIFDFGSELYLWTGQQSLSGKRKVAFHLAKMLYEQPFQCDAVVSPVEPRRTLKRSQAATRVYHDAEGKECGRPAWTLFARLHEKAETLLFQEKFFDWPDPTKIIKMKGHVSSGEALERPLPIELQPCDPTEMHKPACAFESAIVEATALGRGLGTPNVEIDGVVQEGNVCSTLGMTVWLVTQNKHFVLPKKSEGHFHSGDGYVIRWVYFVAKNRVVRDRRGRIRQLTGRQRCAYFFWQGNECSVNEKGAAAIMAVELDEERGPQIRVVEGKEPPHFLKLFEGAMVIHSGKRVRLTDGGDDFSDKTKVRMYCIRNEDTSEGCLVQVRRSSSSLRSRSSFVVVDCEVGNIFIWHGCKANEYHRKAAERAANYIKDRRPIELDMSEEIPVVLTELEEGQEPESFWKTVGGKKHAHVSLLKDPLNVDFSPRLFHLTSATGLLSATEILCPSRYPGRTCPFPVVQEDLYSSCQPAMFILDVGDEVYVWEGWMPPEITKDIKGSAKRRWDEERKLTLQTALLYVQEANNRVKKGAFLVQAGLEPLSFTSHFPFWERRQHISEMKITEGKQDCEKRPVKDVLDSFTQEYYSLQELTGDNPPDGIDLSKLEVYLREDEFQKIFEMSRDLFNQLLGWKQDILKKAFGLF